MHKPTSDSGAFAPAFLSIMKIALFQALIFGLTVRVAIAGSATWNANPVSGDWNTAANWTPATVPNQSSDIATFDVSNTTDVSLSAGVSLDSIVFNAGASEFTLSTTASHGFTFFGAGVINNSGVTQNFLISANAGVQFLSAASAGDDGIVYRAEGSTPTTGPGSFTFSTNSTAGDATFVLGGGGSGGFTQGAHVNFMNDSTAGDATLICQSGGDGNFGGITAYVQFNQSANAGNATIIAEQATTANQFNGVILFEDTSNAKNATLIARGERGVSGGVILFEDTSSGGSARVQLEGGALQAHVLVAPSLTIGSLEGEGAVALGTKTLFVGKNGADTTFRGEISGTGSLVKIGPGTLVLADQNIYSGGTTVEGGRLLTRNSTGSATGTGNVQVNRGAFGGTGIVGGAVTVGTGAGRGASLSPGIGAAGTLTIQSALTLKADAIYKWRLNSNGPSANEVVVNGVTITGAQCSLHDSGSSVLPAGTVFTVISNTAATPISGTFSNLADGSSVTVGSNTFQADYEGGDGNDLTLTVL